MRFLEYFDESRRKKVNTKGSKKSVPKFQKKVGEEASAAFAIQTFKTFFVLL